MGTFLDLQLSHKVWRWAWCSWIRAS